MPRSYQALFLSVRHGGLDPATQMDLQRQRRVRLGPRVNPRIKSGDADDGTERLATTERKHE